MKQALEVGNLSVDINKYALHYKQEKIQLRYKEFELMKYLVKNTGKVKSRTQILEDVWDRNIFCNTNTVDVHVSNLRKKMKKMAAPNHIKTIYCVGYMFETQSN